MLCILVQHMTLIGTHRDSVSANSLGTPKCIKSSWVWESPILSQLESPPTHLLTLLSLWTPHPSIPSHTCHHKHMKAVYDATITLERYITTALYYVQSTSEKLCPKRPQPKSATVTLTDMICSCSMTTIFLFYFILIFVFLFCDCKFFGSCNIPLEKSWNFNVWVQLYEKW